jgi:hypothetical protein
MTNCDLSQQLPTLSNPDTLRDLSRKPSIMYAQLALEAQALVVFLEILHRYEALSHRRDTSELTTELDVPWHENEAPDERFRRCYQITQLLKSMVMECGIDVEIPWPMISSAGPQMNILATLRKLS